MLRTAVITPRVVGRQTATRARAFSSTTFKALRVEKPGKDEPASSSIVDMKVEELMEGDVVVDVEYSSLNYKDGKALAGQPGVVKNYPFIPGIDLAGTVAESSNSKYRTGDKVVLTGYGVGERHYGGYAQKARVKSDWLVPLPEGLTTRDAMGIGTAGFTAMMCVMALERANVKALKKPVLVTGAGGGVGSVSIAILDKLGYDVIAASGRGDTLSAYLKDIGASDVIPRSEVTSERPLGKERWAGGIDTVGGDMLAGFLAQTAYGGSVAACGLARGHELNTTVFPFILRGVNLLGIDSVYCPQEYREEVWERLAEDLPLDVLRSAITEIGLGDVAEEGNKILEGKTKGRVVVNVNQISDE